MAIKKLTVTNTEIILPCGHKSYCTMKDAHRFAGLELERLVVVEDLTAPTLRDFRKVVLYLKSRVRRSN